MNFEHEIAEIEFNNEGLTKISFSQSNVAPILDLKAGDSIERNHFFLGRESNKFYSLKLNESKLDKISSPVINIPALTKKVISKNFFNKQVICGVIGCRGTSERFTTQVQEQCLSVGKLISDFGFVTLTGGLSGVMEFSARGAKLAGGQTLGILPGSEKLEANNYIDYVVPSGIGFARNYLIAQTADILIALNGGRGTLEEICYGLDFDKKVLSINSWDIPEVIILEKVDEIVEYLDQLFNTVFIMNIRNRYAKN